MNGRNYDMLLGRMTSIANRHEELKRQLETMTQEEVQRILDERRDKKISTRLANYERALALNPIETPKVMSRRRPPEVIQKARELKWSAVAFERIVESASAAEEHVIAASTQPQINADFSVPRLAKLKMPPISGGADKRAQLSPPPAKSAALPGVKSPPPPNENVQGGDPRPSRAFDVERVQRTTAIEGIRLQLQKQQLQRIQQQIDAAKSFPGYKPPPQVVYSNPDEQLQAPWRAKALCARPSREKKPWALPVPLRPRRKKKIAVEMAVEDFKVEDEVVAEPVKSAMELMMMDMDDDNESIDDGVDAGHQPEFEDPPPQQADDLGTIHETLDQVDDHRPVLESPKAIQLPQSPPPQEVPVQSHDSSGRPDTCASAYSEADSVFTRDSDLNTKKKVVVLTGEATHAIIMKELSGGIDFEDILLEKVLSGEEVYKICTQKGEKKPLRTGDLFLLGRFLRGDVMLVPESYQESESSGDDNDVCTGMLNVGLSSRGNSRGGPRSRDSKSRSRSRPSTQGGIGDVGFMMASDFVQAIQSKPASRGDALGQDIEEGASFGGREPVLTAKLLDDDDIEVSGGFTGVVPSKYNHLDLSNSHLDDEDMLVLSTSMYPSFTKVPGLVRVNRLLQAAWKDENRYISRIFDWLFDIWEEQVLKCVEDSPYPVLHVRPKSRPPTPDPYGVPPNARKQKKLDRIAVKKSLRIPEPKEAMPLQTLNLSRNGISCQGFAAFLSCLARRGIQDTLLVLDISHTNISVAGGRVLAQFLSKCLFIQKLDCSHTQMTDDFLKEFSLAMRSKGPSCQLTQLDLQNLRFGIGGGAALGSFLATNALLQILNVKNCELADSACWCILRGVIRHKSIQIIELHGNYPGSRFAVALQHLYGHHFPLQSFSGVFEMEADWLSLVGAPLQHKYINSVGYERPPLPIDCDVLRMTAMLPSDDSNYNLFRWQLDGTVNLDLTRDLHRLIAIDISDDAYDGRVQLLTAMFGKKDLAKEMSLQKDRQGVIGSGFIPPASGNLRTIVLRTLFPMSKHTMSDAGRSNLLTWLQKIPNEERRLRFLLSLSPMYYWSSNPATIVQLMTFLKERQNAALFLAAVAAQIGPFRSRSDFVNSLCNCGVHVGIVQAAVVLLGSMAQMDSSNLNGHYSLTLTHVMDPFLLRIIVHRDCFISHTLNQRNPSTIRPRSRGETPQRAFHTLEYPQNCLDTLVVPPMNQDMDVPQLSSFAYSVLEHKIYSIITDNDRLQFVLQGLGSFATQGKHDPNMITAAGLEHLVENQFALLNYSAVVAFSIKCTSSIKVNRERYYGIAQLAEFLPKLISCYRCFSILSRRQKECGLNFKDFEFCSFQLGVPVADLLESFKQLLGDAASTAKMTDKEVKEKMVWVKNEATLPFSKYCMWCLAMKKDLAGSPPQNTEPEFVFLDNQKVFLKTGCTCQQCQSGDVAQTSTACWSCIRNSHRGNVDVVVTFNLLEQQFASGAPVDFTFCCLTGGAYNIHHETDRLFLLLPTHPLELRDLILKISANPVFDARMSLVRHWLVSHNITQDQLSALIVVGGSRRWKAELLVVAACRLNCPVSSLSKCLSSIISSLPDVEASHSMREIGPLACLNYDTPILNYDLDLRLRDERCTLVCVLRMCSLGRLSLKEFVYTSRVQLLRDEFGQMMPWGESLTGIQCSIRDEREWKNICSELSVDPDVFKWNNHEHAPKQGRAQLMLQSLI